MSFAHDTEESLASAVAFVNTATATGGDTLTTIDDVERFCATWEMTGSRTNDLAELTAMRELRARLRRVWIADKDDLVVEINALLREANALPQLVRHGRWDYHLHATGPEQPLDVRVAVEVALALADVVRAGELDRLRTCAADDCDDLLIDLSKNHSKRFCSTTCGNRVAAAASRSRRVSTP